MKPFPIPSLTPEDALAGLVDLALADPLPGDDRLAVSLTRVIDQAMTDAVVQWKNSEAEGLVAASRLFKARAQGLREMALEAYALRAGVCEALLGDKEATT